MNIHLFIKILCMSSKICSYHLTFWLSHDLVNPDGNDEIEIQSYSTSSKVTVKDLEEEVRKHERKE